MAGGLDNAPRNAASVGCECFQMFSRSPRGGPAREITPAGARRFKRACRSHNQACWYIHTPYYINLAADDARIRKASVHIVREELERACALGASAIMMHLGGSHKLERGAALERVVGNVKQILQGYRGRARLLAENSAGGGRTLGARFEELHRIVSATHGRCGVCLDTQHMFASGYDLSTRDGVKRTFDEFDRVVGLKHLRLVHSNDSRVELGSRKDRHEHIGHGFIGGRGFHAIVCEPRLEGINLILETRPDGVTSDLESLKRFRGLMK